MINKKYKPLTIIKQRNSKITEKVQYANITIILKSYPLNQGKSIEN